MDLSSNELLPLSGLQHFAYCPRQFALIHIDQQWEENRFTAEGQVLHQRVNEGKSETRRDLHIARSVRLISQQLGLSGVADVVEFHRVDQGGCQLAGRPGCWQPYPVEYKRGRSKSDDWDRIQLCAQAMALEEMLSVEVPEGALFYGQPRRREQVLFTSPLRELTRQMAARVHALFESGQLPAAEPGPKCKHCSLQQRCMPGVDSASAYLARMLDGQ
ncbi:CRISPR-associated protein Cas4 [uncultured Marinobacter sp.]|jgi:CRISPR-associated exonuclease Cas4|uniref:CRISPR-associated protein Cas4 n=1 Tax=uncultured Marinobacter sp. TaxID=187379 RepID=UPI000C0BB068|nr:CRISPR-associated protein Cas4 [Marinobacter sp.]MBI44448.1 CRISPR-associated protein Cas4 [Oceanospirillales bacterium]|tara:strand:+ start:1565 stop:2215 length:651 start_codon:yes stop_codon:yes gene_type:complete